MEHKTAKKVLISLVVIIILLALVLFFPYRINVKKTIPVIHKTETAEYEKSYIYIDGGFKNTFFRKIYKGISGKDLNQNDYWYFKGVIIPAEVIADDFIEGNYSNYLFPNDLQANSNGEFRYLNIVHIMIENGEPDFEFTKNLQIISYDNLEKLILFDRSDHYEGTSTDDIEYWIGPEFDESKAEEIFQKVYGNNLTKVSR